MAFRTQKVSDVGTTNPIVARLGIQTGELLNWSGLDKAQNEAIAELYITKLTPRLVRCDKRISTINNKLNKDIARVDKHIQKDPRVSEIPYVVDLEGDVQDFLYEAKNYLRDLLGLFRVAYGCKLTDASAFAAMKGKGDSNLVKWAIATFGESDHLVRGLRSNNDWMAELIRRRNAYEHPGENSGTLTIHNVRIDHRGLVPPRWERTDIPESDIVDEMTICVANLLNVAEELLANLVMRTCRFKVVHICEIPNDQRDPARPVRLRMSLNEEMQKKRGEAAAKRDTNEVGEIGNVETSQEKG
ncbi:hypothetical protein [Phyllobacterium zundukense]|uniref:Uncharacterized protein n=1 Tax=Phyllobacterium zundukense TaxID=1867719 RepID=A0A2N9VSK9_9HYPH|nr:hypothetical protein [Phyllobacterium zundukense]ATU92893.1 hypothetical protein BLM14_15625 [Phyllobacterium zundukense]PIO42477.1 hypothetical protein B5P45_26080 [Phyllobacterium zundukense]